MSIAEKLMTAEEYRLMPSDGTPTELVRGVVVAMNIPAFPHGKVCFQLAYLIGDFLKVHPVGRATSNDSGFVTTRNPDSVRGPDVAYYSYARLPKDKKTPGYPDTAADVVFEVRSPCDRWSELLEKSAEYFRAGVRVVVLIDIAARTVHVYRDMATADVVRMGEDLRIAEIDPEFAIRVDQLFEDVD